MRQFLCAVFGALLILLLSTPPPLHAQRALHSTDQLERAIDQVLADSTFENAFWGIYAIDATTGRVLYERHSQKSFVPASNVKLYTTAAALVLLGPDYRYRTPLYASGQVEEGQLTGNLVVRGSGDPVIGGRFRDGRRTALFGEWADSLRAAGIRSIKGDIIGDDDVFDDTPLGDDWSWEDLPFWYAAETSGLSFNDNVVDLTVTAQRPGMPASLSWKPLNTSYVTFANHTRTLSARADYDEEYEKVRGTNTFQVASLLPAGDYDDESLAVTNPTAYFVHVFRESLLRNGLAVQGKAVDADDLSIKPSYGEDSALRRVATHRSPPLRRIVRVTNRRSQNLYAEQLLKTIAAEHPIQEDDPLYEEDLEPGSAAMGWRAALPFLARTGVDTSRVELVDGSGLSRQNFVTPRMTVHLLRHMRQQASPETREAFLRSLPRPGQTGTLRYRFDTGPARQTVHAKTGTLGHVSALSGYVENVQGRPFIFAIMANHFTVDTDEAREAQDRIVDLLARYRF